MLIFCSGRHVAVRGPVVVDQHVGQQARFGVLVADADAHVLDAVEEQTVLEFDGLLLLADVVAQAVHLLVGVGNEVVYQKEAGDGDDAHHDGERLHDPGQRHAGRFHGQQFVVLSQIAHRHDGGQQHDERQTHREHGNQRVAQQFEDDAHAQTLAYQLVDVPPQDVHQQDEHDDEKGHDQGTQIGLEYEFMDGFHRLSCVFVRYKVNNFTAISVKVRVNIMAAPGGTSAS